MKRSLARCIVALAILGLLVTQVLPPLLPAAGPDAPALAAEMRIEGGGTGRAPMALLGAGQAQGSGPNHNDP